jgi:hypothetical protein
MMAKYLPANDPNQPAVPLDNVGERSVVAVQREPHEQLAVGRDDRAAAPRDRPGKDIS